MVPLQASPWSNPPSHCSGLMSRPSQSQGNTQVCLLFVWARKEDQAWCSDSHAITALHQCASTPHLHRLWLVHAASPTSPYVSRDQPSWASDCSISRPGRLSEHGCLRPWLHWSLLNVYAQFLCQWRVHYNVNVACLSQRMIQLISDLLTWDFRYIGFCNNNNHLEIINY